MDYGIVTTVIGVVADIIGVIAFVFDGEKWKKSTKALIVLGLVVGLVVIAVGVGLILNGGGNSGREEPDYVSSYAISLDDVSYDIPSSTPSETLAPIDAQIGKTLFFGSYKQGPNGEIKPIEWRVLDIQSGRALLLSENILDFLKYNDTRSYVTWETCSLRSWLNGSFYNNSFTASEQSRIFYATNRNPNNPDYGTRGGNDTEDHVFLLSTGEAKEYLRSDGKRIAYATDYAHSKGYDTQDRSCWWWLRSPGSTGDSVAGVNYNGTFFRKGDYVDDHDIGVRPAMWLILE